jgi:hypothetical protein
VLLARVVESLAVGRGPHTGEDRELVLEHVEADPGLGVRDPVGQVLALVPPAAESELDPAPAHRIRLGDRDRERPRMPKRDRRDEGSEPDPAGFPTEGGEGGPRVGGAGPAVAFADPHVVVGAEERVEPELLGELRHGEEIGVRGALLGFGEDAQPHGLEASSRAEWRLRREPGSAAPRAGLRCVRTHTLSRCSPWTIGRPSTDR